MPISSLFLRSGPMAKLAVLSLMASGAVAQYSLSATYTGDSFFDIFDFFTGSEGIVSYNDFQTAYNNGLIGTDVDGVNYINVDTFTDPSAPAAVRIVSKAEFTHGLFIAKIFNMPGGYCGISSKFATQGPDAASGAIDIITGTVEGSNNVVSLESSGNSLTASDSLSFGDAFNMNGGGIYATLWDSNSIKVWFWPAGTSAPADYNSASPDPSTWGAPVADFEGCDVDTNFQNNKIVFDTNFCTAAANAAFAADAQCLSVADTCENYISNAPDAYDQSYWAIGSINIYQLPAGSKPQVPIPTDPTPTPTPTPTGPAAIVPVVGGYTYIGCVDDIDSRLINDFHTAYDNMTLESCAADCTGFRYFATEYSRECWCGNSFLGAATPEPDKACYMTCGGNAAEFCGGPMLLNMYELTADLPAPESSSMVAPDATATTSDSTTSSTTSDSAATASDSTTSSTTAADTAATTSDSTVSSTSSDSAASSTTSDSAANPAASFTSSDSASTTSDASASSTNRPVPNASASNLDLGSSTTLSTSTLGTSADPALPTVPGASGSASSSNMTKAAQVSPSGLASASMTLSTVYTTKTYTITSCAAAISDCPAKIGSVTTEIVSLYTTYCPGNPTTTPAPKVSSSSEKVVVMMTTVVVTSYVDVCPGGELTTIITSKTLTIPKPTGAGAMTEAYIPMATTTKTLTMSGSTATITLTIPSGAAAPTPAAQTPAGAMSTPAAAASPKVTVGASTVVVLPVPSTPVYPAGNSTVKGIASGSAGLLASTVKPVPTSAALPKQSTIQAAGAGAKEWSVFALVGALGAGLVIL